MWTVETIDWPDQIAPPPGDTGGLVLHMFTRVAEPSSMTASAHFASAFADFR